MEIQADANERTRRWDPKFNGMLITGVHKHKAAKKPAVQSPAARKKAADEAVSVPTTKAGFNNLLEERFGAFGHAQVEH